MTSEVEFIDDLRAVVFFDANLRPSRAILNLPDGAGDFDLVPAKDRLSAFTPVLIQTVEMIPSSSKSDAHLIRWIAVLASAAVTANAFLLLHFALTT